MSLRIREYICLNCGGSVFNAPAIRSRPPSRHDTPSPLNERCGGVLCPLDTKVPAKRAAMAKALKFVKVRADERIFNLTHGFELVNLAPETWHSSAATTARYGRGP